MKGAVKKMDTQKTGEFLRALRKAKGLTQEEVAEQLFLSPKTVSRWESGAGLPDINIISGVAALYGVTVDEILQGEKKTDRSETLTEQTKRLKNDGRARKKRPTAPAPKFLPRSAARSASPCVRAAVTRPPTASWPR